MGHPSRPEVFVSATSRDLGSCRQLVKEALLTLGCAPVEQRNFPPDAREVRAMLRSRIAACHAVVHVAGLAYGTEPSTRAPGEPRRSYTQLECEIAHELGLPTFVFVCAEGFPYDPHEQEDEDRRGLQRAHVDRLRSGDRLHEAVASPAELAARVHALQIQVERLSRALARSRRRLAWGLAAGVAACIGLGAGVWGLTRRAERTETRLGEVETELDRHRRYVRAVAGAYGQQQAQLAELKLTEAQLFDRAVRSVAEREGMPPEELAGTIEMFVAAVRADPAADHMDRALADFAQQRFGPAAGHARRAAEEAKTRREAAEGLAARAAKEAAAARGAERSARRLEGQALLAQHKPGEAVAAFEAALGLAARAEEPRVWAELQLELGEASNQWAAVSEEDLIAIRRRRAVEAYRAALEVYTREALPQAWARTQNNLAVALRDQAAASEAGERARLLAEAVAAYRAALEVCTREALPQDWARTQSNLANALGAQATASEGEERARLLAEAVAAYRAALEVCTREALLHDWAMTQNNLAVALGDQAAASEGGERARLLAEAVEAYRAALEVCTREALPQDWARTQNNLAVALRGQSAASEGGERAGLLAEAVEAYRAALEICTREALPQDWAMTNWNLALALRDRASAAGGAEAARLLREALEAMRSAAEVYTEEAAPEDCAFAAKWIEEVKAEISRREAEER